MSTLEDIKKAFPNMFRPLKWHHFDGPTEHGCGEWYAHATRGMYHIYDVREKFPNDRPFYAKELSDQFDTLEQAKDAVQNRHELDIVMCLDPDFRSTIESLQRENERLQAEIDRKSSMPGDHRYWEGRYRDEAAGNEKLREALTPFGREGEKWHEMWPDDHIPAIHPKGNVCGSCGSEPDCDVARFTVGDLRRAREACSALSAQTQDVAVKSFIVDYVFDGEVETKTFAYDSEQQEAEAFCKEVKAKGGAVNIRIGDALAAPAKQEGGHD